MLKNIFTKLSVGSYILVGGFVLTLVSMIIALVSCSPAGFAIVQIPVIVTFSILAMLLICGAIAWSIWKGDGIIPSLMLIGAVVLLSFVLFNLIDGKQDVMGTVMFSDLEKGHAPTEFACYVGFYSMISYIISIVIIAIGSFFKLSKAEVKVVSKAN